MNLRLLSALLLFFSFSALSHSDEKYDLVIYGGTPAGLVAATAAARENAQLSIAVIEPSSWIGGVVTGGLSRTDKGNEKTIGGIPREYFALARSLGGVDTPMWYAEPKHNLTAFQQMLAAHGGISISTNRRVTSVHKEGTRIVAVELDDGSRISGGMFIDASYEGDLMARAGVSYIVGRESRETYGEKLAGYTPMPVRPHGPDTMGAVCSCHGGHAPHFIHGTPAVISALDETGEPIAGVVKANPAMKPGDGDGLTQAYNFRLCVTQREDIFVPFPRPENYHPAKYELLLRLLKSYPAVRFPRLVHIGKIANGKYDLNAQGFFSTDYAGGNTGYPDGDYPTRERIFQDHVDYVQGFLWFLGHDERVPKDLRDEVNTWGLCADEFVDNINWSYALYVREARRMIGQYVMKQSDTWTDITKPDSIGMGSFILDCHIVQRIVTPEGTVTDEGSFQDSPTRPYQIPWRSLLPKKEECENLLVPVCLSASHIAYCSIRMEPVYMGMGHACGVAAAMAYEAKSGSSAFPDLDISALQAKLREQKAVLEIEGLADLITVDKLPGVVVDDREGVYTGSWSHSSFGNPVEGSAAHDGNGGKGEKSAVFELPVAEYGRYEIRFAYAFSSNRASAVPVTVSHAGGETVVTVDQRKEPEHDGLFTTLGVWTFSGNRPAVITVRNGDTDSYVSVDAVQMIPAE
ncbi:MAG: FAD-dependent oxidoreductase [Verrucomicrobiales bacterium]|nr:FAD-dependent oxidoreductase [Verrucomicrobiales bacterium]